MTAQQDLDRALGAWLHEVPPHSDRARVSVLVQIATTPQQVLVARVTGAGDTFMAAHIVALLRGAERPAALDAAVKAAATYVSGEQPA